MFFDLDQLNSSWNKWRKSSAPVFVNWKIWGLLWFDNFTNQESRRTPTCRNLWRISCESHDEIHTESGTVQKTAVISATAILLSNIKNQDIRCNYVIRTESIEHWRGYMYVNSCMYMVISRCAIYPRGILGQNHLNPSQVLLWNGGCRGDVFFKIKGCPHQII